MVISGSLALTDTLRAAKLGIRASKRANGAELQYLSVRFCYSDVSPLRKMNLKCVTKNTGNMGWGAQPQRLPGEIQGKWLGGSAEKAPRGQRI